MSSTVNAGAFFNTLGLKTSSSALPARRFIFTTVSTMSGSSTLALAKKARGRNCWMRHTLCKKMKRNNAY
jgi:hypothetical protein